jgi:hypothetical protein
VGAKFAAKWAGAQDQYQYGEAFKRIIGSLMLQYMASVNNVALQLERRVRNVSTAVDTRLRETKVDGLSDWILELNNCSHDIRSSQLEQQTTFAFNVVYWARSMAQFPTYLDELDRLIDKPSQPKEMYSAPLKDDIAEILKRLDDTLGQQRQKQEEQRLQREE